MSNFWLAAPTLGAVMISGNAVIFSFRGEKVNSCMPPWYAIVPTGTIEYEDEFDSYEVGTVGHAFGKYLVSARNEKNREWWDWSYRNMPKDKSSLGAFFNLAESAYEIINSDEKEYSNALNAVCDAVYSVTLEGFYGNYDPNLWKYCSVGRGEIITIENEMNYGENERIQSIRSRLASVNNPSNFWFWKIRNREAELGALGSNRSGDIKKICESFYMDGSMGNEGEILKLCGIVRYDGGARLSA